MEIYRTFTRQTDYVVQYLSVARQYEHHTRVEVPKLKHAPVNLGKQLEEYLHDPDFEVHRRQYLAEQGAKQGMKKGAASSSSKPTASFKKEDSSFPEPSSNNPFPSSSSAAKPQPASQPKANKGPDPDLIDFFDSIEQNQTPMQVNPQVQPQVANGFQAQPTALGFQNGFAPQATGFPSNSPFQQQPQVTGFIQQPQQQVQPNFTGAGFGGYTPQQSFQPGSLASIPQDTVASFQNPAVTVAPAIQPAQPQALQPMQTGSTNPFRQSMMAQQTGMQSNGAFTPSTTTPALQRQSTNPFARRSPQQNTSPFSPVSNSAFPQAQPQQQIPQQQIPQQQIPQQQMPPAAAPLMPAPTGTNPFARNTVQPQPQPQPQLQQQEQPAQATAALAPQPTGSTNPFRQGAFVNHNTGMGWQNNSTPIGGGIDQLPTVPVFPRPAQQSPWQQ